MTKQEYIYSKTEKTGDCLVWTGTLSHGYGMAFYQGNRLSAHRFVWEAMVGAIPEKKHIDHLCRNKRCVNVEHLEPVTSQENSRRHYLAVGSKSLTISLQCKIDKETKRKLDELEHGPCRGDSRSEIIRKAIAELGNIVEVSK